MRDRMRDLVLSDIHGNLAALHAVLDDAPPDAVTILCIGDLVGYGPFPNECVHLVMERAARSAQSRVIAGNHDLAALGLLDEQTFSDRARRALRWTKAQLEPRTIELLGALTAEDAQRSPLLCHGSPIGPEWSYVLSEEDAEQAFSAFSGELCIVGHSHIPLIFEQRRGSTVGVLAESGHVSTRASKLRRLLNPGSVGFPRTRDDLPGMDGPGIAAARYALFDERSGSFEFRRVPYDYRETEKLIAEGPGRPL